jgi:hypothetical protein
MAVEILWGGTSQRLQRTARPNSPLALKGILIDLATKSYLTVVRFK